MDLGQKLKMAIAMGHGLYFSQHIKDNPFIKTWFIPKEVIITIPIRINGFFGDAVIATYQSNSTIASRLAQVPLVGNPNNSDKIINAVLTLGDKGDGDFDSWFRIAEKSPEIMKDLYYDNDNEKPYDVVLGEDFLIPCSVKIDLDRRLVHSPVFGTVPLTIKRHDPLRKFSKDHRTINYGTDADPRIIIFMDVDSFEVQVLQDASMIGKPRIVANKNTVSSCSWEAKAVGISRTETPDVQQAIDKCWEKLGVELIVIPTPTTEPIFAGGKPRIDSSSSLQATVQLRECLKKALLDKYGQDAFVFEFGGCDEFFLDVTELINKFELQSDAYTWCKSNMSKEKELFWGNTFFYNEKVNGKLKSNNVKKAMQIFSRKEGYLTWTTPESRGKRLLYASKVASDLIRVVKTMTGFQMSAGIASTKTIAKASCSLHKPASITVVSPLGFENFTHLVPFNKLRGLGKDLGNAIADNFNIRSVWELRQLKEETLSNMIKDNGETIGMGSAREILNLANGINEDIVNPIDFYKKSSIHVKLYGKHLPLDRVEREIFQIAYDFIGKLHFELMENTRGPRKIKLSIKGPKPGISAILEGNLTKKDLRIGEHFDPNPTNPNKWLFNELMVKCVPEFHTLNQFIRVDEIHIQAEF